MTPSRPVTLTAWLLAGLCALLLAAVTQAAPVPNPQPDLATTCARVERDPSTHIPTYLVDCGTVAPDASPADAARALLAANAGFLGLTPDLLDLQVRNVQTGLAATHVRLQQTYQGLPVWLAEVAVHTAKDGRVQMVENHTLPGLNLDVTPVVAATDAEKIAGTTIGLVTAGRGAITHELLVYPGTPAGQRLAWHVIIPALDPLGDWHLMVDAHTAEVLAKWNGLAFDSGSVYDPNAVQTSGNANLVDNNNANSVALAAARTTVTLLGINSGQNKLVGPYVDLCATGITGAYKLACQADEASRIYDYTRDNDKFEEVTVYAAIDGAQRYIQQTLGFPNINNRAIPVHAHYYADDNSFYSTADRGLHFGDGFVDDAEDAEVVIHEYGHAIQDNQVPGWGPGSDTEQRAMGEGFGDYLAASFFSARGDPTYLANQKPCVADWDATSYAPLVNGAHCLRRTDGIDESSGVDIGRYRGTPADEHYDGRYWSATLWCIRNTLGRENSDRLVLESQFYILPDTSNLAFEHGVDALVMADANLYMGANAGLIRSCALARGVIAVAPVATPVLTYPAGGETLPGGTVISVTWTTNGAPAGTTYALEVNDDCTPSVYFSDTMENGTANWSATHGVSSEDWTLVTANPHSPTHAWFAGDPGHVSDQYLAVSRVITLPAAVSLSFWHQYDTENTYDGGVLEISTDGGSTWNDLGAHSTQNGYNGTISTGYSSPIAGRSAFTGNSGGYLETRVDLGSFGGLPVRFRFRMASDSSIPRTGWTVDDVALLTQGAWTPIGTSAANASSFRWTVPNVARDDVCLRVQGRAQGYLDSSWATGQPFSISATPWHVRLPFVAR